MYEYYTLVLKICQRPAHTWYMQALWSLVIRQSVMTYYRRLSYDAVLMVAIMLPDIRFQAAHLRHTIFVHLYQFTFFFFFFLRRLFFGETNPAALYWKTFVVAHRILLLQTKDDYTL